MEVKNLRLILLTLTEEEANWLKEYVRNPHVPQKAEHIKDTEMREKLFESLKRCDI